MTPDWTSTVPALAGLDPATRQALNAYAQRLTLPRGTVIFRPGDPCGQFPLVASGTVRVMRLTESGRELVLYRVSPNETCILTTACLLSGDDYSAEGVAETDVVVFAIGAERFQALMDRSASFRALVFEGYGKRIAALMSRVEEIACTRIETRLADRLLTLGRGGASIETTQQALAADLGTAREVVGRMLRVFEKAGWLRWSRGHARILDEQALTDISHDGHTGGQSHTPP